MKTSVFALVCIFCFYAIASASVVERQLTRGMEQNMYGHYLSPSGARVIDEENGKFAVVWGCQNMALGQDLVVLTVQGNNINRSVIVLPENQMNPSLVLSGDNIYIAYASGYFWDWQINLLVSHDFGLTWDAPILVSDTWDASNPVAAIYGNLGNDPVLYVAWLDARGGSGTDIYLDYAGLNNLQFGVDRRLTDSEQISELSMDADYFDLTLAYFDSKSVTDEPYYMMASEGFVPTSISAASGYLRHSISVAVYEGEPYVAYIEVTYWGDHVYLRDPSNPFHYGLWETPRAYSCQAGAGSDFAQAGVVWRDYDGIWGSYSEDLYFFPPATKLIDRPGEWDVHFLMRGDYFHPAALLVYDDYDENNANQIFGALVSE